MQIMLRFHSVFLAVALRHVLEVITLGVAEVEIFLVKEMK